MEDDNDGSSGNTKIVLSYDMSYTLLACGSNGKYQLGINNDEDQNTLQPCLFRGTSSITSTVIDSKPIKIACGGNHTLVLFDDGDVYSCGDNSFGQCGHHSSQMSFPIFTKISNGGSKWKDISCGWEFSVLVDGDSEVYVCGRGLKGELGLGNKVMQSELRQLHLDNNEGNVIDVKSSLDTTILRFQNNRLWGWGNCRKAQLGKQKPQSNGKLEAIIWIPRQLDFDIDVNQDFQFSVGRDFTVFYIRGEDDNHQIKVHGKSLGTEPSINDKKESIDIKTMWSSIHQISRDKDNHFVIDSFGNNSHGQLFPYSHSQSISDITHYAIGSEHGLLSTSTNKVYAWGWGEHGNCGIQSHKDTEDVTFDYLNVLHEADQNEKVILVSGGCATSWILLQK